MTRKISKAQLRRELDKVKKENMTLSSSLAEKEVVFLKDLDTAKSGYEERLKQRESEYNTGVAEFGQKVAELENQNKEKQKQLNERELKRLAVAYKEQEDEYNKDSKKWFVYVMGTFVALLVFVGVTVYIARDIVWHEKIELYFMNFIIVTFLIFSLKQFSYYTKLRTDYANRKTLAQSYHNILSSGEDEDLKPIFLEKASDVLCAKSEIKHESYTLPEKLLEALSDISKNLSRKV